MSARSRIALLFGLLLVLGAAAPVSAAGQAVRRAADAAAYDGRLIVVWKGLAPTRLHMAGVASNDPTSMPMRSVVTTESGETADVAATLRADPRVLLVVPDAKLSFLDWPADGAPSDPLYADQGDLAQIGVPDAWKTTTGDPSVVVAVIDSGVDLTHPDLDGVTVVSPRNVFWNTDEVTDDIGHGTHVSGTIVAETNNAVGIAGIAPAASLMPIKVDGGDGFISFSDVLDGVDWARDHGADIINLSLGGFLTSEQVELGQPTFTAARAAGILTVAAAGNDGIPARMYPASFAGVVSVTAVDTDDLATSFDNANAAVDLAAPGVETLSTEPDGAYVRETGTSMASPHVAGVAALVRTARPGLTVDELEAVLRASARDLGDPGRDNVYGDGRVDAAAALAEPVPDPLPTLDPPPVQPLSITLLAPTSKVVQTGSAYTVRLAITGEPVLAIAILGSGYQVDGKCSERRINHTSELALRETIPLAHLMPGRCYKLYAFAIDADDNYAEVISPWIKILDLVAPTIAHRAPSAGATGVHRGASVRVRFSEPVIVRPTDVRLRDTATGTVVRVTYTWHADTNTLVLDPVSRLLAHHHYRVEVGSRIVDRGGNHLRATHWGFATGS